MPVLHMLPQEANTIADYMSTVLLDDALDQYDATFVAADVSRWRELYGQLECAACHQLGTVGGYVGPELSNTGARLRPGWIAAWLTNPERYKPGTLQPDYGLSAADARVLTAYLSSLSKTSGPAAAPSRGAR